MTDEGIRSLCVSRDDFGGSYWSLILCFVFNLLKYFLFRRRKRYRRLLQIPCQVEHSLHRSDGHRHSSSHSTSSKSQDFLLQGQRQSLVGNISRGIDRSIRCSSQFFFSAAQFRQSSIFFDELALHNKLPTRTTALYKWRIGQCRSTLPIRRPRRDLFAYN